MKSRMREEAWEEDKEKGREDKGDGTEDKQIRDRGGKGEGEGGLERQVKT